MNLGLDNVRDLLERFLSDTGGRRGRDREQVREEQAQGTEAAASQGRVQDQPDDPANADAGVPGEQPGTAQQGSTFERPERPDPDDVDDDEVVDDLYHRIETLEDELENNGNQLGSIQDSQEHVADKVDDVDDTIRQLLGIYDQVTNDVNPFTGDGEEKGGFGVFGADDDEGFGLGETRESEDPADENETVSFADLKGAIEDAAATQSDRERRGDERESTAQKITFDEEAYIGGDDPGIGLEGDDDTRVEVQATGRVGSNEGSAESESESRDEDADDVTLHTLADTYATDIIVFEWLTELVRTGGPAATLRAISYYHEIGWIGRDVKEHLESVLSGPDLDIHVDPASTPDELTAEDHADSYTYIMKLNEIHATRQEVES